MFVRLDPCVPNAHAHIFKTPDVRAIMSLRDVHACSVVNACMMCEHVAIVRIQCNTSTVDHSSGTNTV
jgi:hypothetical protein